MVKLFFPPTTIDLSSCPLKKVMAKTVIFRLEGVCHITLWFASKHHVWCHLTLSGHSSIPPLSAQQSSMPHYTSLWHWGCQLHVPSSVLQHHPRPSQCMLVCSNTGAILHHNQCQYITVTRRLLYLPSARM